MSKKPYFEVASGKVLREKYGLTAKNRPAIRLDASRVPNELRCWIPLAERWGISDDLIREDCIENATQEELQQLLAWIPDDAALSAWLTGLDSRSPTPTEEYLAFTCLGMAYDSARVRMKKRS